MVGRIPRVALSEHGMGVSLLGMSVLRVSLLVDYSGADGLLMASTTSEASFSEVTLVDGMTR